MQFTDERGRLPVGEVTTIHGGFHFIRGHVVDQRLTRGGIRCKRHLVSQTHKIRSHVHGCRLPAAGVSDKHNIKIWEDREVALRYKALLTKQRTDCCYRTPRMKIRWRLRVVNEVVVQFKEVFGERHFIRKL